MSRIGYPDRVIDRVLSRVVAGHGGCWISTYSRGSHGYAQIGWQDDGERTVTLAHRIAWYSANRDAIAPGWTVDHICHVRPCVRPSHLRLLLNKENARDNGQDRRDTEPVPIGRDCRRGHPLLLFGSGATNCRECVRESGRRKDAAARMRQAA